MFRPTLEALGDRVILRDVPAERLGDRSLLFITEQAQDAAHGTMNKCAGEIVAVGPQCVDAFPAGPLVPGLRVVHQTFRYVPLTAVPGWEDVEGLRIIAEGDILGIIDTNQNEGDDV